MNKTNYTKHQNKITFEEVMLGFKETQKMIYENDRILTQKFQETDKQMRETDKKLKELGIMHGGLSNNIGESVEDFFYYGFEKKPVIGKIRFKNVVQNMKTDKVEYDIALTNGRYIAIIEVKHKFKPDAVIDFLRRITLLREEFGKFKDCKVIVGIAGFVIPKTTKQKAIESGLFIFTQSGENIKQLNEEGFKPTFY